MKNIAYLPLIIPTIVIFFLIFFMPSKPFADPLWKIIPTPTPSAEMMRIPVPHGWMVTYKNLGGGIVYIPDEKHEWKVK